MEGCGAGDSLPDTVGSVASIPSVPALNPII